MKFRKKPVVVEAEQYVGEAIRGVCYGVDRRDIDCYAIYSDGRTNPHVHTIHPGQTVTLEVGDWVIAEPDGEHFYPCKADIFQDTYEIENDGAGNGAGVDDKREG